MMGSTAFYQTNNDEYENIQASLLSALTVEMGIAGEHMTAAQLDEYLLSARVFHVGVPIKGLPVNRFKY